MKCLNCNSEKFEEKNMRFTSEIKNEEVEVVVPAFVCKKCQDSFNGFKSDEYSSQSIC